MGTSAGALLHSVSDDDARMRAEDARLARGLIWLLNDFDLLSTLLHAATLSLEALLVGGVLFLLSSGRAGRRG